MRIGSKENRRRGWGGGGGLKSFVYKREKQKHKLDQLNRIDFLII